MHVSIGVWEGRKIFSYSDHGNFLQRNNLDSTFTKGIYMNKVEDRQQRQNNLDKQQ